MLLWEEAPCGLILRASLPPGALLLIFRPQRSKMEVWLAQFIQRFLANLDFTPFIAPEKKSILQGVKGCKTGFYHCFEKTLGRRLVEISPRFFKDAITHLIGWRILVRCTRIGLGDTVRTCLCKCFQRGFTEEGRPT